jgi:hypothetical protein
MLLLVFGSSFAEGTLRRPEIQQVEVLAAGGARVIRNDARPWEDVAIIESYPYSATHWAAVRGRRHRGRLDVAAPGLRHLRRHRRVAATIGGSRAARHGATPPDPPAALLAV